MGRKGIYIALVLLVAVVLYRLFPEVRVRDRQAVPSTPPTLSGETKRVETNQLSYSYQLIRVLDTSNIELVPNFVSQSSSSAVIRQRNCREAVSGGFYDKNSRPLGLFISGSDKLSDSISSSLFNGFFSLDVQNIATISAQVPGGQLRLGLQTGPLLLWSGQPIALTLTGDKSARRLVASLTTSGEVVFITLYDSQAPILGPYLTDLPILVKQISDQENLTLQSAINLDGGRASFFYTPGLYLPEVSWPGSIICLT